LGRAVDRRDRLFAVVRADPPRADADGRRLEADVRALMVRLREAGCLADLSALARRAEADAPEVRTRARAFGRAVRRRAADLGELRRRFAFCAEALRAGRDALRAAFLLFFRPAFRVPGFTLRFAIANVLSASHALSQEDPRHP
jgi:hypothetical protein